MKKNIILSLALSLLPIFLYSAELKHDIKNDLSHFFFFNNSKNYQNINPNTMNFNNSYSINNHVIRYSYNGNYNLRATMLSVGIVLFLPMVGVFIGAGLLTYIYYCQYNDINMNNDNFKDWADSIPINNFLAGMIACWIIGGVLLIASIAVWTIYGLITNWDMSKIRFDNKNNEIALSIKI